MAVEVSEPTASCHAGLPEGHRREFSTFGWLSNPSARWCISGSAATVGAEVLFEDLERSPQDMWFAVEDLWLRLATWLPTRVDGRDGHWQSRLSGFRHADPQAWADLRMQALNVDTFAWRLCEWLQSPRAGHARHGPTRSILPSGCRSANLITVTRKSLTPTDSPPSASPQPRGRWRLQDAKARFSEVVRMAHSHGPQHVTLHGRDAVVVVDAEEFRRFKGTRTGQLLIDALQASPHRRAEVEPPRSAMPVRAVKL